MHLFFLPLPGFFAFGGVVTLVAAWRGDWAARVIALGVTGVSLVEYALQLVGDDPYNTARGVICDIAVLAVCLACVARARRYWVLLASAFALLALVTDLMAFLPHISNWAWASGSMIWVMLLLGLVLWSSLVGRSDKPAA